MRTDFVLVLVLALAASCGGPTALREKPGPRGLHADQHVSLAKREDTLADELTRWPERNPGVPAEEMVTLPWRGHWDTAEEHRRSARSHRDAAAALQAAADEACRDLAADVASASPLRRYGVGGTATGTGVAVVLRPEAGPPARLLVELRCHRAWMMLGRSDMDDCPLDLPGLRVDAVGDEHGITLTMTVDDVSLVPELQRRAAHDVEAGSHAAQ